VGEIRDHIEYNEKFRTLYGDWTNKGRIWKANEFVIKPKQAGKGGKESSVTAGSLEKGSITGKHFSTIILDDVVSVNNVNSEEAIQKTIEHYKLLLSILNPGGQIIVVGTRWGMFELYSWLQDPEGPEYDQVDTFYRAAEDKDGNLLMPEVLTRDFLNQQRKTQGSYIYSCQYLNRPESSEINIFKKEYLRYYTKNPEGLIFFMTVDPALSERQGADYSGLVVNGVDYYGNWYIQEAIGERLGLTEIVNKIFELNKKYQPMMCIGMEKFALEKVLQFNLNNRMQETGIYIPIKEIDSGGRIGKEARIKGLQPFFEQRKIYIKKSQIELEHQLLYFPQIKYDDIIDALKSQIQIVFPSDVKPLKKKDGPTLTSNERKVWSELDEFKPRRVRRSEFE
jgi:predicted phage terminase large subunit-like protein